MILYIENSKDSTKKLLEQIHEFSREAGYTINTEISCILMPIMNYQKGKIRILLHSQFLQKE